jgi:hypothetical protein
MQYLRKYGIRVTKSRRMNETCSMHREMRNSCTILLGKPEGMRLLRRSAHRWVNTIKQRLKKHGLKIWTGLNWLRIGSNGTLS